MRYSGARIMQTLTLCFLKAWVVLFVCQVRMHGQSFSIFMEFEKFDSGVISQRVRELMERHGIGERKQAGELARILVLSPSAAHRKLNGESSWSIDQAKAVVAHFNSTLGALLDSLDDGQSAVEERLAKEAVITLGESEVPCLAWIEQPLESGSRASLVAVKREKWCIVPIGEFASDEVAYEVSKIEIYPKEIGKLSVAIIDDDVNTAHLLSEYLNEIGTYKSTAFFSTESTIAALQNAAFDAYIVDWFVGRGTSEALIKSIRASSKPDAAILLLTGQISTGKVHDTEIADIMLRYKVFSCQEKPVRLPIIAIELAKALKLEI